MSKSNIIPLVHGHVYIIQGDNLKLGAYNQDTRGFVGVRRKFGNPYLVTEYTVSVLRDTNEVIPENIVIKHDLGAKDIMTKRPVEHVEGRGWRFIDTQKFSQTINPTIKHNGILLGALRRMSEKYATRT